MRDFDVIVIGGGSAGTAAARSAVDAGARTAMINDGELGGLCILRGCMPTKAMLASAHALHETTHLEPFGVRLDGRAVADFAAIMARKDAQVARFKRAKIESIERQDYEVIDGRARFAPGGGIVVGRREQSLAAGGYVIATGSTSVVPPIPGIDDVPTVDSDGVMRLTSQPERLLVLGAGPTGLELAQFFARIGTEVTLVNRSPLLRRFDSDVGEELTQVLADEPRLEMVIPATIDRLEPDGDGLTAVIRSGEETATHHADLLLVATGRRPDVDSLGLEHAGINVTDDRIEHDDGMRTTNPKVWVAGDTTGSFQILHLANQEGAVAGHNAAGGTPERKIDYRLKMWVTFTDPPHAHVGITEEEAERDGLSVVSGVARFPETGRAITMETRHGLWKVLIDRESYEILGSSIVGPRADDLIHTIAVMMHHHDKADVITRLPWYHPTLSEVLLNVERDLARRLDACPVPIMPPA